MHVDAMHTEARWSPCACETFKCRPHAMHEVATRMHPCEPKEGFSMRFVTLERGHAFVVYGLLDLLHSKR